jgi:hypothetical protein
VGSGAFSGGEKLKPARSMERLPPFCLMAYGVGAEVHDDLLSLYRVGEDKP